MSDPVEVLEFWLGEIGPEGWYAGTPEVDDACAVQFGDLWAALHEGNLEHWVEGTVGTLAYLIVADQFARNIHRGKPEAFATDARARDAARKALAEGWDLGAPEPDRQFFYMPFEHSEDPADQAQAIALMQERLPENPDLALHARAHAQIIARFGRFPFRNAALGRDSSAEEQAFMDEGGYGAIVRSLKASHAPDA
jgi:uncharacterized protein (DUF924 family)